MYTKKFLSSILIFIMIFSSISFAQETATVTNTEDHAETIDPGTTPDSILYGLELTYENVQLFFSGTPERKAELASEFTQERFAEISTLLQQGEYTDLKEAFDAAHNNIDSLHDAIQEIEPTQEHIELINQIEKQAIENENQIQDINKELQDGVTEGKITTETLESIDTKSVEEVIISVEDATEETKEDIVDFISNTEGITTIEAELQIENIEKESQLPELHQEEIKEEFAETVKSLENLEIQYEELSLKEDIENDLAAKEIIEEAKTKIQICKDFYQNGEFDDAFKEFAGVKNLITNAENVVNNELSDDEVEQIREEIKNDQLVRSDQAKNYVKEYEEHVNRLIEKYPERKEEFEKNYDQNKKVSELTDKIDDRFAKEYSKLKDEEGKTEEEASKIMSERFAQEYRLVYGEEYTPPSIISNIDEAALESIPITNPDGEGILYQNENFDPNNFEGGYDPETNTETFLGWDGSRYYIGSREGIDTGSVIFDDEIINSIGGFVEDYEYEDPVTGIKYEFSKDGYKYTTPFGETYDVDFPDGYKTPEGYEKGNEVHSKIEKTPEGSRIYNYYATGYEVVHPDGETETFAYPEGEYEVHGGGEIAIEETGFEIKTEDGETREYDYNPKFETYVSKTGAESIMYTPPEGAAIHHEEVEYTTEGNSYNYVSPTGESWSYDATSNSWRSSAGEVHKVDVAVVAPVGHEAGGEYTTESGEKWNYEAGTGKWVSSTGESYSPSTQQYQTDGGEHSWTYDSAKGVWASPTGETHAAGEVPGATSESASWTYDPSTGAWTSSSGESHTGAYGTYTPGSTSGTESGGYTSGDGGGEGSPTPSH